MYCGKCGNKLENDAKFCNLCGTPAPPEAEASEGETGENIPFGNTETAEKKESGNGKGIAVIAICVVSAILIIAGTLFGVMRCRRMDEKEISETAPVVEMETAEEAEKPEERPKESADVKEQEPEPEPVVRDYYVDYAEAYKLIVRQAVASTQGADGWAVHDMDGDGMPELFVQEGNCVAAYRWLVYTYDMEQGTACFLGEAATGSTMLFEPENREAGIIAAEGHMGMETVYSVKKVGKDGLNVTEISHSDNVQGDYYSTPYPLCSDKLEDEDLIGYHDMGATPVNTTGLRTPGGREVYQIPGDAYATSVLQEPDRKHSTDHLFDLNPSTVWVEGVSGPGEGEAVVIDTTLPYTADGVAILPGYCRDQAVYAKNGRPVKVTVKCGDTVISESLENFKPDFANPLNSMIYIEFDEPVYTDRYTVVISRAIGGTQYEDTCIAELFPYTYSNTEGYDHY